MAHGRNIRSPVLIAATSYAALSALAATLVQPWSAASFFVEDRRTLWRARAGFEGAPLWESTTASRPVHIDERGFRIVPGAARNGKAPVAIISLGDSFTFGWDVADDETYPAQLQTILEQARPGTYEVINGGIPGFTSFQAARLLPTLIREEEPGIVTLMFGRNDNRRAFLSDEEAHAILRWKPAFLNFVFPGMFIHYRGLQFAAKTSLGRVVPRVSHGDFARNLGEIVDVARRHGIGVIMIQHWIRDRRFEAARIAASEGVAFVPARELFAREQATGKGLFLTSHFHPNAEGYRLLAGALASMILDESSPRR